MQSQFWGGTIALDLFFGGIGVGTFLFAVLVDLFYRDKCDVACKVAAIVTPLSVAFGFLFLVAHLGHPERFYVVYTKIRLTSPIWWGSWLQAVFFFISLAYARRWVKEPDNPTKKTIGYVGVPFALAVGVYHGFVLMVFKSRPLWNTGPMTVTAICGFIMTGIAAVVLILSITQRHRGILEELKISRNIMGVAILAGLVIPLATGAAAIVHERRTGTFSYAVPLITSLLVLIGGFATRYVVIAAA